MHVMVVMVMMVMAVVVAVMCTHSRPEDIVASTGSFFSLYTSLSPRTDHHPTNST